MTVARFYREKVPSGLMRNGMVAQLAGILGTRTVPTESHLARADIHLLQSGAMFGLAEDPAPLLAQAARFLQIKQPPPFPEVNRLAAVDRQERDEDRAAIVAANQLDLELYRRAREQLNRSRASWPHRLMPWLR
jgi:hypothetical protein